jgi:hypothetical protein
LAADSGLIGHHDHDGSRRRSASNEGRDTLHELDILDPAQVMDVMNDNTIPIEEQGGAAMAPGFAAPLRPKPRSDKTRVWLVHGDLEALNHGACPPHGRLHPAGGERTDG